MSDTVNTDTELTLVGLDGSNPLAFLAAIGTLRTLTIACPNRHVKMSWRRLGAWRPVLQLAPPATNEAEIVAVLDTQLGTMRNHPVWSLGSDLNVPTRQFRDFARNAVDAFHNQNDRTWADFVAAFGSEATPTEDGKIQDTALRTMSGAGHQHFVQFMANIVERTTSEHLSKTLFAPWRYEDAVQNQTLRWDPSDDVRRALRWRDPSGDPARTRSGGMLGANRLAIEALPLLPCQPAGPTLQTTGFSGRGSRGTRWTWPIWSGPLSLDVVRSLLAHPDLICDTRPETLADLGVVERFRVRRLTVGKFRNFSPAWPA